MWTFILLTVILWIIFCIVHDWRSDYDEVGSFFAFGIISLIISLIAVILVSITIRCSIDEMKDTEVILENELYLFPGDSIYPEVIEDITMTLSTEVKTPVYRRVHAKSEIVYKSSKYWLFFHSMDDEWEKMREKEILIPLNFK